MTYTVPKGLLLYTKMTTNCDIAQCNFRITKAGFNTCVACLEARVSMSWRLITVRVSEGQSVCIINEKKLAHFTALCSAWDYLKNCFRYVCFYHLFELGTYRSERCKLMSCFFSFLHMHLIHKLSVKSIHVYGLSGAQMQGLIITLYNTFPHAALQNLLNVLFFPAISSLYREKNVPNLKNLFEDIAEHLFNHCKSAFLAEVNLSFRVLVFKSPNG